MKREWGAAAMVTALFGAFGCGAARPALTGPADGGARWTALTSAHVVLETDLDVAEAREKIAEFERMHDTLARAMRVEPPPQAPRIEVVLFARERDFFAFAGERQTKVAYFMPQAPGDLEPRPVMVMHDADLPEETRITFQHELAHRFLHARFATLPRWLDEGLAQYYATVEARPDGIVVGEPGPLDFWPRRFAGYTWLGRLQQVNLPSTRAPSVSELVTRREADFHPANAKRRDQEVTLHDRDVEGENYAASWRLVHYLMHEASPQDRARFASFLAALERREPDAFGARFGSELARLDASFRDYLERPTVQAVLPVVAPPREPAVSVAALSDGDVRVLWSRLLPRDASPDARPPGAEPRGGNALAVLEAEKAVQASPDSADARYQHAVVLLFGARYDDAQRELDEALARRPHDPRCIYAKVVLAERRRMPVGGDLVGELAGSATSAVELEAAARYAGDKRLDDGLLLAARSVAADPLCWRCQLTRAALLARGGDYDDATAAVDRALVLLPEQVPSGEIRRVRQQLAARR